MYKLNEYEEVKSKFYTPNAIYHNRDTPIIVYHHHHHHTTPSLNNNNSEQHRTTPNNIIKLYPEQQISRLVHDQRLHNCRAKS